MKIKLAEALLRRKELAMKVEQLKPIQVQQMYEVKVTRKHAAENIDDVVAQVPRVTFSEVVAEYDHYSKSMRLVDAAIQQANWTSEVEIPDDAMNSFLDHLEKTKKSSK